MNKTNKTLIAITFYERKGYLSRILNYYNQFKDSLDIVILDQSKETWNAKSHPKVKAWHHFPTDKYNFYQMWDEVCNLYGDYDFIYWNNDDDFATPSGIKIAEEFLVNNPAYSLAQGQVVQLSGNGAHLTDYGVGEWFKEDCNQPNIEARLHKVFTKAYVNPHATMRLKTWHSAIKLVLESINSKTSLAPIRFWDKIVTLMAAIDGYRKTNLPCVTAIRTHRNSTGAILHTDKPYPEVLERQTSYENILKRLEQKNPFIPIIERKGVSLNSEQVGEFVLNLLNPANINFATPPLDKLGHLPINQQYGNFELYQVLNVIK